MTKVLVIRKDDRFSSTLREADLNVVNLELIETRPVDDLSALKKRLAGLSEYDGIFFTSPVAAEIFVRERAGSNGFYGGLYALGTRAKRVLEAAGLNVRSVDDANTAEEMLTQFGGDEFAGKRYLFVRGEKSLRTIPQALGERASVDEVAVYCTVPSKVDQGTIEMLKDRLSSGGFDLVCFFSPSGVERFTELFGDAAQDAKAAAVGTTTAAAARQAGLDVEFVSPRSNAEDFALGLIEHVRQAVGLSK